MKPQQRLFVAALVLWLPSTPLAAHHSPAAYDLQAQVTVSGTVTDYEWGNPHVYVSVRDDANRVWVVEAFPSTAMKQYGWSAQTLAAGQRVTITGNPGRNPARSILSLRTLRKADAVLFDAAAALAPPRAAAPSTATARATSLAGTWSTAIGPAFFTFLGPNVKLPATPAGAAAIAEFRDTANPGVDCVPFTAPLYMIVPGFRSIEVRQDVVLIRGEDAAVERTVHLGATHASAVASVQGHSVGQWEGAVLVVDTTHFAPHRLGNGAGLPSGAQKHVVECFSLTPDGALTYAFVLEDSEYLTQPLTGTAQWAYRPDVAFVATPCDRTNARRFLAE